MPPTTPITNAAMTNAVSLVRKVRTPTRSATSSSSRIARSPRPSRLRTSHATVSVIPTMSASERRYTVCADGAVSVSVMPWFPPNPL